MNSFARTDTSLLGRWWWTVDRWTLLSLVALMGFGAVLMLAASPAAAERIGLQSFQLASRQIVLLPFAAAALIAMSLATPRWVRRLACLGLLASIALLGLTLVAGPEIKGATRWISLGGFSLQPSEFAKPCFAVVSAWLFSLDRVESGIPGPRIAVALWVVVVSLLLMQPDVGQAVLLTAIWGTQLFLAGLPLAWIAILAVAGASGLVAAYFARPHVTARIDSFFDPAAGDRYQINR
jgi:cell division protein FtsW